MPVPVGLGNKIWQWFINWWNDLPANHYFKRFARWFEQKWEEADKTRQFMDTLGAEWYAPANPLISQNVYDAMLTYYSQDPTYVQKYISTVENLEKNRENAFFTKLKELLGGKTFHDTCGWIAEKIWEAVLQSSMIDPNVIPEDIKRRVRGFLAIVTELTIVPQLASLTAEVLSAGQIDSLVHIFTSLYFNLGLGFITWQITSPLIEAILAQPLSEWAKQYYRPQDISLSKLEEILTRRIITENEFRVRLRRMGYKEEDINLLVSQAFTPIPVSEIWRAFEAGYINQAQVKRLLREHGYSEEAIELMIQNHMPVEVEEPKKTLRSTLIEAFEQGLIDEGVLQMQLSQLGYSEVEIYLIINLTKLKRSIKKTTLEISRIKEAFLNNILNEQDAVYWLSKLNLSTEVINVLIQTWKAEKTPPERLLSQSSILLAYEYEVIDRAKATELLKMLNYSYDAINILLDTVDKRIQERRQAEEERRRWYEERRRRKVTVEALMKALALNIITEDEFRAKLAELGFKPEDIEFYVKYANATYIKEAREVSISPSTATVLKAYVFGIITEEEVRNRLKEMGFKEEDINLLIRVATYKPPEEEEPVVRYATISAILKAYEVGIIDEETARAKLALKNLATEDIELYLALARYTPPSRFKEPSKEEVLDWFQKGIISWGIAQQLLSRLGFSDETINFMLHEAMLKATKDEIVYMYLANSIDYKQALELLTKKTHDIVEADRFLDKSTKNILAVPAYVNYVREVISREEFIEILKSLTFTDEEIEKILKTAEE